MTPQDELTLLETAYAALVGGGVQSYSVNNRQFTYLNLGEITARMDTLRAIIYRQSHGMFGAARNRPPE